ncbi:MAG TPA: hypothetical protein PK095_18600 [Myxococcota bacterium]|nr:hypothetical protein [Myxococcota bacterium]
MNTPPRMHLMMTLLVSLQLSACKLTPDMPTAHCGADRLGTNQVEIDLYRLEAQRNAHAKDLAEAPQLKSIVLKSFLLHYERVMGPLVSDGLLTSHGLPAFEPPRTLDEASAQLKVLEAMWPLIQASLGTHEDQCIEATDRHERRAICQEMRRDFDSFSRLCSRVTGLFLRFEAGEWTASGLDPFAMSVLRHLFKHELADRRAQNAVKRVHGELSKFTHFDVAWNFEGISRQEFSEYYRQMLQRLVLVGMAGAVAPDDCGPIRVECKQ